jgi:hypothetical protein
MIGKTVKMYRNLNNGMIAIRDIDTNKVIGYCSNITLSNCHTKVGKGTAATIKRKFEETGKRDRNVHAFIIGTIVSIDSNDFMPALGNRVSYNPFKADHFYYCDGKLSPFTSSTLVTAHIANDNMITIAE